MASEDSIRKQVWRNLRFHHLGFMRPAKVEKEKQGNIKDQSTSSLGPEVSAMVEKESAMT